MMPVPIGRWNELAQKNEKIKYDIITELGLFEKVKNLGWKSLTAKETGKIGGLITKKKKQVNRQATSASAASE